MEIENESEAIVKADPDLLKRINHIISASGIGLLTAATIVGETNGFNLISNKKQLVNYAGYDVVEKTSETSVCPCLK